MVNYIRDKYSGQLWGQLRAPDNVNTNCEDKKSRKLVHPYLSTFFILFYQNTFTPDKYFLIAYDSGDHLLKFFCESTEIARHQQLSQVCSGFKVWTLKEWIFYQNSF